MAKKKDRRIDHQANQIAIREKLKDFILTFQRMPTYKELAHNTGLGVRTIERHIKDMDLAKVLKKYKLMTDDLVLALATTAMNTGKAAEVKLFMQIVWGWREPEKTDQPLQNDVSEVHIYLPENNRDEKRSGSNGEESAGVESEDSTD